ncbi:MAG TPA: hypothetical protein VFS44_14300 [Gemmatimonadaceae bacterium]|nr:hypothetical protein [Gemmatimonadaceae bacterium]
MAATTMEPPAGEAEPVRSRPFTSDDVAALRRAADAIVASDQRGDRVAAVRSAAALRDIAARIERAIQEPRAD